jgi:hypothetical protein
LQTITAVRIVGRLSRRASHDVFRRDRPGGLPGQPGAAKRLRRGGWTTVSGGRLIPMLGGSSWSVMNLTIFVQAGLQGLRVGSALLAIETSLQVRRKTYERW